MGVGQRLLLCAPVLGEVLVRVAPLQHRLREGPLHPPRPPAAPPRARPRAAGTSAGAQAPPIGGGATHLAGQRVRVARRGAVPLQPRGARPAAAYAARGARHTSVEHVPPAMHRRGRGPGASEPYLTIVPHFPFHAYPRLIFLRRCVCVCGGRENGGRSQEGASVLRPRRADGPLAPAALRQRRAHLHAARAAGTGRRAPGPSHRPRPRPRHHTRRLRAGTL